MWDFLGGGRGRGDMSGSMPTCLPWEGDHCILVDSVWDNYGIPVVDWKVS